MISVSTNVSCSDLKQSTVAGLGSGARVPKTTQGKLTVNNTVRRPVDHRQWGPGASDCWIEGPQRVSHELVALVVGVGLLAQ